MSIPSQILLDRWLEALLPRVPETGWTMVAAKQAAREIELTTGEQALAAPNGISDLIDRFIDRAVDEALVNLSSEILETLRMHERVAAGLKAWLDALEPHREAVRKAAGHGLLPWGSGAAAKRVWSVADAIWEAAGDTATDYNRQTKRALLSAVIPRVVMYWLEQRDPERVERFIMTRLQEAMKLGQAGGKVLGPALDFMERVKSRRAAGNL